MRSHRPTAHQAITGTPAGRVLSHPRVGTRRLSAGQGGRAWGRR
jgi:hypothetical protein